MIDPTLLRLAAEAEYRERVAAAKRADRLPRSSLRRVLTRALTSFRRLFGPTPTPLAAHPCSRGCVASTERDCV